MGKQERRTKDKSKRKSIMKQTDNVRTTAHMGDYTALNFKDVIREKLLNSELGMYLLSA